MEETTILRDTWSEVKAKLNRMPVELARFKMYNGELRSYGDKEYIYENDDKIISACCGIKLKFNKTSYYGKVVESAGITYDKHKKKITVWGKGRIADHERLFENLLSYKHIDWFNKMDKYPNYSYLNKYFMTSNTLAAKIISGKVTNPKDFIKEYLKISYKCNNIPYKLVRDFLQSRRRNRYTNVTLKNILNYSTNPIQALTLINSNSLSENQLVYINELLPQCYIFNRKINFAWSEKRLNREYKKFSNAITNIELASKDGTSIKYNGNLPLLDNMIILDNEIDIFRESKRLQNNLYNFWSRIKSKNDFALKYTKDKEECVILIIAPNMARTTHFVGDTNSITEPFIHSIYGMNNKVPSKETTNDIYKWFNNNPLVKSFFMTQVKEEDTTLTTVGIGVMEDGPMEVHGAHRVIANVHEEDENVGILDNANIPLPF